MRDGSWCGDMQSARATWALGIGTFIALGLGRSNYSLQCSRPVSSPRLVGAVACPRLSGGQQREGALGFCLPVGIVILEPKSIGSRLEGVEGSRRWGLGWSRPTVPLMFPKAACRLAWTDKQLLSDTFANRTPANLLPTLDNDYRCEEGSVYGCVGRVAHIVVPWCGEGLGSGVDVVGH
jgi:hypothetical protein